ncbi:DUF5333 family protein [Paracoccaceae bacterium GXU_MW_L88]
MNAARAYLCGLGLMAVAACEPVPTTGPIAGIPSYLTEYSDALSLARIFDARCSRLSLSETEMTRVKYETYARLRTEPDASTILSKLERQADDPTMAARMEAQYQAYLSGLGIEESNGQAFCAAGEQEIAKGSLVGRMLVRG